MKNRSPFLIISVLAAGVLVAGILSAGVGAVYVSPAAIFSGEQSFLFMNFRVPRLVIALLVGAGLGISGAILQAVIRNPLASPDVIGITKGAGFAAASTIILFPGLPPQAVPVAAFLGAGIVTAGLYLFAFRQRVQPATLALVGIALGAIFQAGIQFLTVRYPVETNVALVWLTGSLWGKDWSDIWMLLPWIIIFSGIAMFLTGKMDILQLGDDVAEGLGESVKAARIVLLLVSVVLAGVSVAIVGTLGFVGLVAPHIARQLVGNKHIVLLPASALTGMILLLVADGLGRGLVPPTEIPAGIFTAVIGAPYFLYLLRKMQKT
ncbi:FecCD family ABC transporter permease [Salimicrobium salexigens]|uniref:Iron complex transport system permease protein n=1 Tax=Salimicrobium salexigens TaxID=908941 RepID=A0ABY1KK42_9BACI|nr:iron chelate uptake ABC transporter family permease subunit [Salimicrobium salexigens]SIS44207.1 iron complex transport system permease protein [Salimicrobium salexigens]